MFFCPKLICNYYFINYLRLVNRNSRSTISVFKRETYMEVSRLKINFSYLIFKRIACKIKTELTKAKQNEDKIEITPIKKLSCWAMVGKPPLKNK